ncbi:MAG: efflux transporter outer membrane subunit [Rhodospirillales bacterium]|nr:efflux transporter outer membrane subunit [Rhodospirillales bacterium]
MTPVAWALALSLLAGCAVGPDYAPPETQMPDRWHQQLVRGLSEGRADLRTWWVLLDDRVLDRLIAEATRGNLDLKRAVSRLLEARAQVGLAAGEELPSIETQGEVERGRLSEGVQEELGSSRARTSTLYQLGLDASWELDLWGRIGRNVESADAALQATVEDYRDVLVSLYAEVANTYVEIRTLQARIDAAEGNVASQRQTLQLVSDRRRAELASDVEIAQAQLNLATTEALIPQLRTELQRAIHRLGILLGLPPSSLYGALEQRPLPQPPAQVPIGLPADLLRQRPDIRSAERRLAAQTAQIGVATADLYPRFTLSGFLAFQKYGVSSFFNGDNIGYGFGPTVIWNVFDGGRIRSNIAVQDAQTEQALFVYEQTVLQALRETQDALAGYVQEKERRDILRRSVVAANDAVRLVTSLYVSGLTDFQNVQDQQRSKFQQEDAFAQSQGLVIQNLIALYRALGGGWAPTADRSSAPPKGAGGKTQNTTSPGAPERAARAS